MDATYTEIVVSPPSFKVGVRKGTDGKSYEGIATFQTPAGPVSFRTSVELPEALKIYAAMLLRKGVQAAEARLGRMLTPAELKETAGRAGDAAGETAEDAASHARIAAAAAKLKAHMLAMKRAKHPAFAKRHGAPTLIIPKEHRALAGQLVDLLRAAGRKDRKALARIAALRQKASGGDKKARLAWILGSHIGQSVEEHRRHLVAVHRAALARKGAHPAQKHVVTSRVHGAESDYVLGDPGDLVMGTDLVGDGTGDGYGVPGYVPPACIADEILRS